MATEKRLIDADALKALFDERYDCAFMQMNTRPNIAHWEGYCIGVNWGRNTIADATTVDAVEVVHGRWIPLEYDGYADGSPVWDLWECSECQEEHSGDEDTLTPYCPYCGAKMDGGYG